MALPLLGAGLAVDVLPFTPANIPGLQLWLDASDASTLFQNSNGTTAATADGDPVGYWGDKSENNWNLVQSDGSKKPAIKLSIKNGRSVVRFDGTNDFFRNTTINSNLQTSLRTIFVVARSLNANFGCIYIVNNTLILSQASVTGTYYDVNASNFVLPAVQNYYVFVAKSAGVGLKASYIVNGSSSALFSSNQTSPSGNATVDIGSLNVGSFPFGGDLLEVLHYSDALSDGNINLIRNYLNNKWSIY